MQPQSDRLNHPLAQQAPHAINDYLNQEIEHEAIAGPFDTPPFIPWFHTSPMMVCDKKDSQKRVIVDLSWPLGCSVNANIPTDFYEGAPASMTLPKPMDLAQAILQAPPTAHLFCLDLSRAYRQLRVNPQEWPLLGLTWNNQFYFDLSLEFRGRWHAAACQRVTEALRFILAKEGITVWPYLDDIVGLAPDKTTSIKHFSGIREIMQSLGLQEAIHKAVPPTQMLTWIGIHFDVVSMTMTIPHSKLSQAKEMVTHWLAQSQIPHRHLQQLTGKLAHIVKCCPTSCLFMSRLYDSLATQDAHHNVLITTDLQLDLQRFARLLNHFRGIHLIRQLTTDVTLTVDSCLTGAGTVTNTHFYMLVYPPDILRRHLSITLLEMFNVLIAVRLWGHMWRRQNVLIFSDNAATVATLQSGRAQQPFLRAAAREIWLIAALYDVHISVRHRPGASTYMRMADALFRIHLQPHLLQTIRTLESAGAKRVIVPLSTLTLPLADL